MIEMEFICKGENTINTLLIQDFREPLNIYEIRTNDTAVSLSIVLFILEINVDQYDDL